MWLATAVIAFAICAGVFYAGVGHGPYLRYLHAGAGRNAGAAELAQQQAIVDSTRRTLQQNLDALALRLGQMNAHVVRLDALGTRLTQMAGLQDGEFDFSSEPSLGGPEEPLALADTASMQINGIVNALAGAR